MNTDKDFEFADDSDIPETDDEEEFEEDVEWAPEILRAYGYDVPPEGCMACGGPYPDCAASCGMFDD